MSIAHLAFTPYGAFFFTRFLFFFLAADGIRCFFLFSGFGVVHTSQVVVSGASIGFLPSLEQKESIKYWQTVIVPEVRIYVAKIDNQLAGVMQ